MRRLAFRRRLRLQPLDRVPPSAARRDAWAANARLVATPDAGAGCAEMAAKA
jgi:hypothetical protein